MSSTAEHSRQVEHYMQMIDQYQKQPPVYQHHSIEEGSDDDEDSDSASQSQSQAQRSNRGDVSPVSYLVNVIIDPSLQCDCSCIADESNLSTEQQLGICNPRQRW